MSRLNGNAKGNRLCARSPAILNGQLHTGGRFGSRKVKMKHVIPLGQRNTRSHKELRPSPRWDEMNAPIDDRRRATHIVKGERSVRICLLIDLGFNVDRCGGRHIASRISEILPRSLCPMRQIFPIKRRIYNKVLAVALCFQHNIVEINRAAHLSETEPQPFDVGIWRERECMVSRIVGQHDGTCPVLCVGPVLLSRPKVYLSCVRSPYIQ